MPRTDQSPYEKAKDAWLEVDVAPWLGELRNHLVAEAAAEALGRPLESGRFPRLVITGVQAQLLSDGMDPVAASRVSLRCGKLALLLLEGATLKTAAAELNVADRTIDYDVVRLRNLVESGNLVPIGQQVLYSRAAARPNTA